MFRPNRFIDLSFALISRANSTNKHFSFIVRKNNILSIGINSPKTHRKVYDLGYKWHTIHSEFDAIQRFPYGSRDFSRCRMINVRVNTLGEVQDSKPCVYCEDMLRGMKFKEVIYSLAGGEFCKLEF